jgi:hypothetical protein
MSLNLYLYRYCKSRPDEAMRRFGVIADVGSITNEEFGLFGNVLADFASKRG